MDGCLCGYKDTYCLKVAREVETKPFGVINVDFSLILKKFPISNDLKEELMRWAVMFGKWINWKKDMLSQRN